MRLLAVEDEPELADLFRRALERAGFAVDLAAGIAAAEDAIAMASYDVIVLDLTLSDGDGLTLLTRLRGRSDSVPVLILTARDAPADRVAGLDAGADDYLVKPFDMAELVARLRALLRRPNAGLGVRLRLGNLSFDTTTRATTVDETPLLLTVRETSLLELLMRRQGRVVSRAALDEGLYAFDDVTTPNALEALMHRLRRKLQDGGASVQIHTIRGVGYLLSGLE